MARILIVIFVLLLSGCTNLFYQPSREIYFEPSKKLGLEPKEISFSSHEGPTLHGWFFQSAQEKRSKGLVVQFHGNAENMTSHFASTVWMLKHGYDLFAFDYRGYGKSEGSPYPSGVNLDALAALTKAGELVEHREKSVIVYGQSLGGTIALRALGEFPEKEIVKAVVIEGSFLSYKSVGREKLGDVWITWPFQWMAYLLLSDQYSPKTWMKKIAGLPILFLHSKEDPIVSIRHGKDLFSEAAEPKCFWEIPVRTHTNSMNVEQGKYRAPLLAFIEEKTCPDP